MFKWINRIFSPSASTAPEPANGADSLGKSEAERCKNRGNAHLAKGELDAALDCYRKAVALDPSYADAYNNLGFVYLQQTRYEDAEVYFNRAISLNPKLGNAYLNLGNLFRRRERLDEAVACFQQLIALNPQNADAHYHLGNALYEQGKNDEAITSINCALSLDRGHFMAHNALGLVFQRQGRLGAAIESYRAAVAVHPDFFVAHHNLGVVLRSSGKREEAQRCLRLALALNPRLAETHVELGRLFQEQGMMDTAVLCYQEAISLRPDYHEAHCTLGLTFLEQGKLDNALACFDAAIRISPDLPHAHSNRGLVLMRQDKLDEAVASYRRALSFQPNYVEAVNNIASALQSQGKLDEALSFADKALSLRPGLQDAHIIKGVVFQAQHKLDEAEACFRHVLTLAPEDTVAARMQFNIAVLHLERGALADGWQTYTSRFHAGSPTRRRDFPQEEWSGEVLKDKALLIWGDQGIGDEILFANMFPEVIACSRRCVIECAPKLVPLFSRSFSGATVVARSDPPHPATLTDIDCQSAAAELARWLRPKLESFPVHDGYLKANPARVAYWKARLAELGPGLKVGFCWRSGLLTGARHLHYTSLDQWGPIFGIPGVQFINLQYDRCADELARARKSFGAPLHAFEEVDLFNDLDEAAALSKALDLVITAPTSAGRLSAAQGVPTWELIFGGTWVCHGTDHVPWLPALREFPRRWNQDWEEIIGAVAEQLRILTAWGETVLPPSRQEV